MIAGLSGRSSIPCKERSNNWESLTWILIGRHPWDREILLRRLVHAEQGVAEGKAFIAEHQRLIVELERDDCHDTAETMRLLEAFLVLQEDRAKILDELSE